jgi:uncharacterized protein
VGWVDLSAFFQPGFEMVRLYVLEKLAGAFIPAFFIAGAIATFIPRFTILRYLSKGTSWSVSYPIALVGGGVLSVCACGILPLFQTIYQRGAGLGPAMTFLFAGPAINIIAIVFTYQFLGFSLGTARLVLVPLIALGLGVFFARFFDPEQPQTGGVAELDLIEEKRSPLWVRVILFLGLMAMVLTLPVEQIPWKLKAPLNLGLMGLVFIMGGFYLTRIERRCWLEKSWFLIRNIVPKLVLGVFLVGLIEPFVTPFLVEYLVRDDALACLVAAVIGGVLYLGTILGVVAVKGLVTMGMPDGPALALLLSGPTIALPSMIVLVNICGARIALSFSLAVILVSALAGFLYTQLGLGGVF